MLSIIGEFIERGWQTALPPLTNPTSKQIIAIVSDIFEAICGVLLTEHRTYGELLDWWRVGMRDVTLEAARLLQLHMQ